MSNVTRRNPQEMTGNNGRYARIVELGRAPVLFEIEGESTTVAHLVETGSLSPEMQIFVNSRPATMETEIRPGDSVVAVRKIVAG